MCVQQLSGMREEEAGDDAWFNLPDEDDDGVNFQDFEVSIRGPVSAVCACARAQEEEEDDDDEGSPLLA